MIHGGGAQYNSANRWFDKTVQIVVSGDGAWGLCYEHSMAEGTSVLFSLKFYSLYELLLGVPIVQLMEKLWKHVESLPTTSDVPSGNSSHLPPPERLEWTVESSDLKRIEEASEVVDNLVKDLDFQVWW